jgi:hypothetical protein
MEVKYYSENIQENTKIFNNLNFLRETITDFFLKSLFLNLFLNLFLINHF